MDRRTFSFRQQVRHTDLNGLQEDLAQALHSNTRDLLGAGIVSGGTVSACSTPDTRQVRLSPTLAWDSQGRRVHVRQRLTDCVSAVIPLRTLHEEAIKDIPKGDGTLLLLAQGAKRTPSFQLAGKTALLRCATQPPKPYTIAQTVVTTLGGLIPKQTALRMADALPQAGYTPGMPPTGTGLTVDIVSDNPLPVDVSHADDGKDLRPKQKGSGRVVSLYARCADNNLDWRLDGHGHHVAHRQLQHFQLRIDATAAAAAADAAKPPTLRTNGDVLLADIRLRQGQPIQQQDIDTTRQTRLHSLQALQPQYTSDLLHMTLFGEARVRWEIQAAPKEVDTNKQAHRSPIGTCTLTADLHVRLPSSAVTQTLPALTQPLQDQQAVWVLLPRQARRNSPLTTTVLPAGKFPPHAPNQIPWLLAQRQGNRLYGWPLGRLEPGQSRHLGDGIAYDTLQTVHTHSDSIQQLRKDSTKLQHSHTDTNKRLLLLTKQLQETREQFKNTQQRFQDLKSNLLTNVSVWCHWTLPDTFQDLDAGRSPSHHKCRIAVGNSIYYNLQRSVWQKANATVPHTLRAVACCRDNRVALAVGDKGTVCCALNPHKIWYTTTVVPNVHLTACAHTYYPDGQWVLVGHEGTLLSISNHDLTQWVNKQIDSSALSFARHETSTTATLRCVACNQQPSKAARWVVGGDTGTLLVSQDASTWKQIQLPLQKPEQYSITRMLWDDHGKCFCAVVASGSGEGLNELYISKDANVWQRCSGSYGVQDCAAGQHNRVVENLCVATFETGYRIFTCPVWNFYGYTYTGVQIGSRLIYDPYHYQFCCFQPGGKDVWESPRCDW